MENILQTPEELLAEGLAGYNLGDLIWSLATAAFVYVFMAIGMHAIAKRRGIRRPWMAWVPFGNTWLLGCISDQYRYVARGQEKSKRKVMLGLDIGMFASGAVAIGLLIYAMIGFFRAFGRDAITDDAMRADLSRLLPIIRGLAKEYADVYISLDTLFDEALKTQPEACYYSGDGVHPNANGAAFIGRHYAEAVKPLVK